ncbi:hypothetical protein, partial [Mesorhizobium abyssinicae]|uniref:hypothetical protein n=1 Tax=Mesorhizobium abyssinicae TaxID=1209958 RepID=UPI003CF1B3B2
MQSFDQDELFAAAERAGPFTAASFASQFGQDAERVVHSPAQSVDQPRSRAAIEVGYEALSSMPPPRVNLPATGFGSAPDVVNFPHVVADAYRPAANQQGVWTGARRTMPAEAPHQAAVVQQTRRRRRDREHPDEALLAAYRDDAAKTAKVSESSIARDIAALRKFSKWLDENHQSQIAGRLDDRQLVSLAKDFAGHDAVLMSDTKVALGRLRQHSAGQSVTAAPTVRLGTKDDEELFAQYRAKAVVKESTVRDIAALRKFSTWLDENHRTQIAGRIEDPGLDALAKDFAERESARINPALKRLRQAFVRPPVTAASNVRPVTKDDEELFAQAAGLEEGTMGGDLTGARHTMPAEAPHQASVVQQPRSRKRVREHPDEALFAAYRDDAAKTAKVSERSIAGDITALRKFSTWLDENHQSQIHGRIEDEQLDSLAKDFAGNDAVLLGDTKVALGRLRQHFAGQPVTAASAVRPGTKDDEELFAQYRAKAVVKAPTVRGDLAALRKFSKWLDENHRTQIAGRIEDPGLDALAKDFAEGDIARINPALKRLRQAFVRPPVTAASNVRPVTKHDEELFAQAAGLEEGTMGGDLTGARHTMPAEAPHQASVVQQPRSRKRVREHPDEALFAAYRDDAAKTAKVSESSIARDITALRKFSTWLDENHQSQIDGRIDDEQLDSLAKDFAGNDAKLLSDTKVALGRLRQHFAGQPVTIASNIRERGTKDDEELLAGYQTRAVTARLKEGTMWHDLAALRKFSKWLDENHRTQIAGRLDDRQLDSLAKDFASNDVKLLGELNVALGRLRQHSAGQTVTTARSRSVSEENQEIEDACRAAASRYSQVTLTIYRSHLCRFNGWLSQNFGKGIDQIEPAVLSRAVDEYKKNVGPGFGTAWGFLQKYRQMVAANNALGLSAHGQAAPREQPSGPAIGTAQSASPFAFSPIAFSPIPMSPGDPAWDVLRAFHEEEAAQRGAPMATNVPQFHQTTSLPPEWAPVPAPSSPAQSADSSSTFAGLAPLSPTPYRRPDFDLNALTP